MTTARLLGIEHSPWTERARWALDHHGIAYTFQEYAPILGELGLRLRLRAFSGKVTVPVLFDGDTVLRDSIDIVHHADARGGAPPLAPANLERDVLAWNARAEKVLAAGRSLYVRALLEHPEALAEQAPSALPRPLRAVAARTGTLLFKRKHSLDARSPSQDEADIVEVLDVLRADLRREYVLGRFSLADISMAVSLEHVSPVGDAYIRRTPAARVCSTHNELAQRYADLIAWRDALYARHRRAPEPKVRTASGEAQPT